MIPESENDAIVIFSSFVASFVDKSVGVEAIYDLARMNGQHIDTVNYVLVH